jgi:hypothetical protein
LYNIPTGFIKVIYSARRELKFIRKAMYLHMLRARELREEATREEESMRSMMDQPISVPKTNRPLTHLTDIMLNSSVGGSRGRELGQDSTAIKTARGHARFFYVTSPVCEVVGLATAEGKAIEESILWLDEAVVGEPSTPSG